MLGNRVNKLIELAPIFGGFVLHFASAFAGTGNSVSFFSIALFIWSVVPYICITFIAKKFGFNKFAVFFSGLFILVSDAIVFWAVYINPTSSTSSLKLLVSPIYNLFLFAPIGFAFGFFLDKFSSKNK